MMRVSPFFIILSLSFSPLTHALKTEKNLIGREEILTDSPKVEADPQSINSKDPPTRKRSSISTEIPPDNTLPQENESIPIETYNSNKVETAKSVTRETLTNSENKPDLKTKQNNSTLKKPQSSNTQITPKLNDSPPKNSNKTISFSGVAPTFHPVSTGQAKGAFINTSLNNGLFGEVKPLAFSHETPSLFTPISPTLPYTAPLLNNPSNIVPNIYFTGTPPAPSLTNQNNPQLKLTSPPENTQEKLTQPCLDACNSMISAYKNQSLIEGFQVIRNDEASFALFIRQDVNQNWNDIHFIDAALDQKELFEKMCKGGVALNIDNKNKKQMNIFFRETEELNNEMKKQIELCQSNIKTAAAKKEPLNNEKPAHFFPQEKATNAITNSSHFYHSENSGKAPIGKISAEYKLIEPGPPGPNGEWAPGTRWVKVSNPATPSSSTPTTTRSLISFPKN